MRLTFLGSGDAFCDWRVNYNNNVVIETADGLVLIDCGHTAVQSMRELGLAFDRVSTVLVTHVHADHASLTPLLLERFYGGPGGPRWQTTRVCCPDDVMVDVRRVLDPYFEGTTGPEGGRKAGGLDAVMTEERGDAFTFGALQVRFFPVPHLANNGVDKPAYGLELVEGGRRVIYSSDTTFQHDWLIEVASAPDVVAIFHDCTFSPRFPSTVHTHFEELETLPDEVKARITLMHHVAVPAGVDIGAYAGEARRHQVFEL